MADKVNFSIVPRNGGKEVLLVPSGDGWSLPAYPHSEPHKITEHIKEVLGAGTVVAGTIQELAGPDGQSTVFAHENLDATTPAGARWVGRAELSGLSLAPELRTVLEDWFAKIDNGAGSLPRVAWTRDGWFDEAANWMTERLGEHGVAVTGPVEQFLTSPWSCTLRVPTGEGHAYLKAAPEAFGYEADLTNTIADWFPDNIVPIVAVDSARGWMLSTDIGPCTFIDPVTSKETLPEYLRSVSRYAAIQREAVNHVDALIGLGVPDRRLAVLPDLFDDLLADTDVLMVGQEGGLPVADHQRLLGFAPRFRDRCARLAEFDLPETLVNVDYWHGNVSFRDKGDIVFDWAESAITHPMFSLTTVIREFEVNDLAEELRTALVDTYLGEWNASEAAYELAQPGSILCRAQTWRDSISSLTELSRYRKHNRAVVVNISRMLPYVG